MMSGLPLQQCCVFVVPMLRCGTLFIRKVKRAVVNAERCSLKRLSSNLMFILNIEWTILLCIVYSLHLVQKLVMHLARTLIMNSMRL